MCEELRQRLGFSSPLVTRPWPEYSEDALVRDTVTVVLQVNGKLRGKFDVDASATKEQLEQSALTDPNVQKHITGLTVRKVIVVPGKLVNIVAG